MTFSATNIPLEAKTRADGIECRGRNFREIIEITEAEEEKMVLRKKVNLQAFFFIIIKILNYMKTRLGNEGISCDI